MTVAGVQVSRKEREGTEVGVGVGGGGGGGGDNYLHFTYVRINMVRSAIQGNVCNKDTTRKLSLFQRIQMYTCQYEGFQIGQSNDGPV